MEYAGLVRALHIFPYTALFFFSKLFLHTNEQIFTTRCCSHERLNFQNYVYRFNQAE